MGTPDELYTKSGGWDGDKRDCLYPLINVNVPERSNSYRTFIYEVFIN